MEESRNQTPLETQSNRDSNGKYSVYSEKSEHDIYKLKLLPNHSIESNSKKLPYMVNNHSAKSSYNFLKSSYK
jgi:hypothetical protein